MLRERKADRIRRRLGDEAGDKYEHMQRKAAENSRKLKGSMIGHLSTLNDGVIAIFITVMMLEIPFPASRAEYPYFMWSIAVFFISFFTIAGFWYENKRIFETMREGDHLTVVMNFVFLASLALIPVTTKWIIHSADRASAMNFGAVYFLTTLFQELLRYAVLRKRFVNHRNMFLMLASSKLIIMLICLAALMLLSYYFPKVAIVLYVILPVWTFFMQERERRTKNGGQDGAKDSDETETGGQRKTQ